MKKNIIITILILLFFTVVSSVSAANLIENMKTEINNSRIQLSDRNIEVTAAEVLQYFLGFLGIVFFVLIFAAGLMWMTAAGVEDKITKAKKILTSASIGLVVVFASYLISYLVVYILQQTTTAP